LKVRLDSLLVSRGLAQSRERATALILSGVVLVNGEAASKAGQQVADDAAVALKAPDHPYVGRGGIKLATLKSGQLHDQLAYSGLEFLPISGILASGHESLRGRIKAPDGEAARESADFEWTALLNTILCMVNGVNEHGHGGMLLLVAPGSEGSLPVRMKFDVDEREAVVTDKFIDFVNARHRLAAARARARHGDAPTRPGSHSHLKNATFVAEEDLADAADVTARLSAVDGALVVRSDLALLGFGAEIVLDATQPLHAFEVTGHPLRGGNWPAVDVESFGMRHRSALRCIGAADGAAQRGGRGQQQRAVVVVRVAVADPAVHPQ